MALAAYSAEHDIPHLTPNQWGLIEKAVAVLNPVEEITVNINRNSFSVSYDLILENHNDRGIRTMKSEMLSSLEVWGCRKQQTTCPSSFA